jgi:hypothetical protein
MQPIEKHLAIPAAEVQYKLMYIIQNISGLLQFIMRLSHFHVIRG